MKQKRIYEQPRTEDLITVGTNIRISRARCLQIMEEVREGTKELRKTLRRCASSASARARR